MSINFDIEKVNCEDFCEHSQKLTKITKKLEEKIKRTKPNYLNKSSKNKISLTKREIEVLKCIVEGKNNTEISNELFITLATAKAHVSNIIHKLGVNDRAEAGYIAKQLGII